KPACGDGTPALQNSIPCPANQTVYKLWVKMLMAHCSSDGTAKSTDSLMEKLSHIHSQVVCSNSGHEGCSAIVTAVCGSRLLTTAPFCMYTREEPMCSSLTAFPAIQLILSLRTAKAIFG